MKHKRIYKLHIFECIQCTGSYLGEFFLTHLLTTPETLLWPASCTLTNILNLLLSISIAFLSSQSKIKMMLLVLSFIK